MTTVVNAQFLRHSCSELVSGKRRTLPRLNFLSFQETLTILGGWQRNEKNFQVGYYSILPTKVT